MASKVFVDNISTRTDEAEFSDLFRDHGEVRKVEFKGKYAFVEMKDEHLRNRVIEKLHGFKLHGLELNVEKFRENHRKEKPCYNCGGTGHYVRQCPRQSQSLSASRYHPDRRDSREQLHNDSRDRHHSESHSSRQSLSEDDRRHGDRDRDRDRKPSHHTSSSYDRDRQHRYDGDHNRPRGDSVPEKRPLNDEYEPRRSRNASPRRDPPRGSHREASPPVREDSRRKERDSLPPIPLNRHVDPYKEPSRFRDTHARSEENDHRRSPPRHLRDPPPRNAPLPPSRLSSHRSRSPAGRERSHRASDGGKAPNSPVHARKVSPGPRVPPRRHEESGSRAEPKRPRTPSPRAPTRRREEVNGRVTRNGPKTPSPPIATSKRPRTPSPLPLSRRRAEPDSRSVLKRPRTPSPPPRRREELDKRSAPKRPRTPPRGPRTPSPRKGLRRPRTPSPPMRRHMPKGPRTPSPFRGERRSVRRAD